MPLVTRQKRYFESREELPHAVTEERFVIRVGKLFLQPSRV